MKSWFIQLTKEVQVGDTVYCPGYYALGSYNQELLDAAWAVMERRYGLGEKRDMIIKSRYSGPGHHAGLVGFVKAWDETGVSYSPLERGARELNEASEGWDANGSPVPGPVLNDKPSWALPDVTIQTPSTESAGRQFTIHKKAPGCDCGAVHTSNPNHHSDWCSNKSIKEAIDE